jgi:hypothetical protein
MRKTYFLLKMKNSTFVPSLPPPDSQIPDRLFEYSPPPAPSIRMKSSRKSYRFLIDKLTHMAERAKAYEKLPADHPDRLRFKYRQQIMVELFRSTNMGLVDLNQLENESEERYRRQIVIPMIRQIDDENEQEKLEAEKMSEWKLYFQEAVLKAVDELGIVL